MIQSTEQINKILCDASKLPRDKRQRSASSAIALHDAHLQRLKAHRSGSAPMYNPVGEPFALLPLTANGGPSASSAQMVEEVDESSVSSHLVMAKIRAGIRRKFHGKLIMLSQYLSDHSSIIRIGSSGHPIVGGKELQRGNILDIMQSLYIGLRVRQFPQE
jgi:hypothetical protein